jgi:hypothetical protein
MNSTGTLCSFSNTRVPLTVVFAGVLYKLTAGSPGHLRHPFQNDEASHVVDEVRHSDLTSRANDADGAHAISAPMAFF